MNRLTAFVISLGLHLAAAGMWFYSQGSSPQTTTTAEVVVLPSQLEVLPAAESMPGGLNEIETPAPVEPLNALLYAAEQTASARETTSSDQPGLARSDVNGDASTARRHDDFVREEGRKVPLLRVTGLNAMLIDHLRRAGHAELVLVRDGVEAIVDGPLDEPVALRSLADGVTVEHLAERMLPIPADLQPSLQRWLTSRQALEKGVEFRLALTIGFDRTLLQTQTQALARHRGEGPGDRETIGHFEITEDNHVQFVVDRVR